MTNRQRYFRTTGMALVAYVALFALFLACAAFDPRPPSYGFFIGLIIAKIGFIAVSVLQAREKGRNPILWGILELLSSGIATVVLLLLPYTDERRYRLHVQDAEQQERGEPDKPRA